MTFVDEKVQREFNQLTGQKRSLGEIDINDVLPELKRFGLIDSPLTIQDHFIQRSIGLRNWFIDIVKWQKVGYEIRYFFKREDLTATLIYWINGKNEFRTNFQKLAAQTTSDQLFEEIVRILPELPEVRVNRNNAEGILTQIQYDVALEEEKPFLKYLFDQIKDNLGLNERITNVQHLNYRERYTIESIQGSCDIDFEYDGKGFFGRVLPILNNCKSPEILEKVKLICEKIAADV